MIRAPRSMTDSKFRLLILTVWWWPGNLWILQNSSRALTVKRRPILMESTNLRVDSIGEKNISRSVLLKLICNGFSQNWWKVVSSCLLQYKPVCVINFDKLRSKMLKSRSLVVSLVQGRSYIWGNRGGRLGCFQDCCLSENNYFDQLNFTFEWFDCRSATIILFP